MPKTFLEYINYVGGFGLSYAHSSIKPIASLGDTPPKGHGSRDSRVVGLQASAKKLQQKNWKDKGFGPYKFKKEDTNRIPRKPGQKAGSDKHSDLYTDENPKGTIHGLGFTDAEKAKQSVSKIKNSGKSHAHKIQAAIAMSQRAKVASERAKDPEKKKNLGAAHRVYQSFINTNKKTKE